MLAELPAVVVQDGGDLAASELSIDQHSNGLCPHFCACTKEESFVFQKTFELVQFL